MRTLLIVTMAWLALGASRGSAQTWRQPNELLGTDTLFNLMRRLTANLGIQPSDLEYVGGGSGGGQNAMVNNNRQEIAPMSRFLNNCSASAPETAGCWRLARDFVPVLGHATQACTTLTWGESIRVEDLNGVDGLQCPNCVGSDYEFSDWRTILRVIYFGKHGTGTADPKNCNSDVRHTLVSQWGNLFRGGCATGACANGLRRAYRRDDVSGTTDTFVELLQAGAISTTPFCNGTDRQNLDPITRPCNGNGYGGNGEHVCTSNGRMGLVLPVLTPEEAPFPAVTQNCGLNALGGAATGFVSWTLQDQNLYGNRCPDGSSPGGGLCAWPRRSGSASGTGFDCVASRADRPTGTPNSLDARVYNLWRRNSDGSVLRYARGTSSQPMNVAFYRNHQFDCRFLDSTDNIGCYVGRDSCTIGYAGRDALTTTSNIKGLGLRSKDAPFEDTLPLIENFDRYGITRVWWMCTWDRFANTTPVSPFPPQPASFIAAQQRIVDALESAAPEALEAVTYSGFLTNENNDFPFVGCPR